MIFIVKIFEKDGFIENFDKRAIDNIFLDLW
jgi:hypothetical protein